MHTKSFRQTDFSLSHIAEKIGQALHRSSEALTQVVGGTALAADEKLDEKREKLESRRPEMEARRDLLRARIADRKLLGSARLIRAFPNLKHMHHAQQLEELKEELRRRRTR